MGYDEEYFKGEEFQELLESYEMAVQSGELPFMDADDLVDIADYYSMQGSLEEAMKARAEGKQVLVTKMNKNKKFQKQQLEVDGYSEFVDFYREELKS